MGFREKCKNIFISAKPGLLETEKIGKFSINVRCHVFKSEKTLVEGFGGIKGEIIRL